MRIVDIHNVTSNTPITNIKVYKCIECYNRNQVEKGMVCTKCLVALVHGVEIDRNYDNLDDKE